MWSSNRQGSAAEVLLLPMSTGVSCGPAWTEYEVCYAGNPLLQWEYGGSTGAGPAWVVRVVEVPCPEHSTYRCTPAILAEMDRLAAMSGIKALISTRLSEVL